MIRSAILCAVTLLASNTVVSAQFTESGTGNSGSSSSTPTGVFNADETLMRVQPNGHHKYKIAGGCGPQNPKHGPPQFYAYSNNRGTWKLPPVAQLTTPMSGSARYTWNGVTHSDRLTYIAHGHIADSGGGGIKAGTQVSVWALMASDNQGNTMFFYVGTHPVIFGSRYPMYYSWDAPGPNAKTIRIKTLTGTKRL